MAIESLLTDQVAPVSAIVPASEREAEKTPDETRRDDVVTVTPSVRPDDDASRTLFEQRNEDPAVEASVAAQRYQQVQEGQAVAAPEQPSEQARPQAIAAAQGAGNVAVAAMVRPPENPQANPPAPPGTAQSIQAAVRVRA